jgi:ATP-dependent Lon protease
MIPPRCDTVRLLRSPPDSGTGGGPSAEAGPALPPDALPILPVREAVLFPGAVIPLTVGRPASVAAVQYAMRHGRPIGVLTQRQPEGEGDPMPDALHRTGTIANILRWVTTPDGTHQLVCQGVQRFRVLDWVRERPFLAAGVYRVEEDESRAPEVEARLMNLRNLALEALSLLPQAPQELVATVQGLDSAPALADLVAATMDVPAAEKQAILETVELVPRLDRVSRLLAQRIEVMRLSAEIGKETRASLEQRQREVLLREQMAAIQRQLGEDDAKSAEIAEIEAAIASAGMPEEAEQAARKEVRRLQRMPEAAGEYGMVRTWLDWMTELPWRLPEEKGIEIAEARRILDEDHHGLEKIKRRILEYLAVRKLAPGGKAPILCFVGPPGVGKTSLGESIARAMGRAFVRVSLGGVHDEAEIRGHRRTYIGALPGNIVQAIRKAKSRDCVMMLDEIDKMGRGIQGDPSAAMLEVLDPEQNGTFRDNYLGVPFDLSRVVFIATANMLDTVPGPLRDRMEVIELAGYTEAEKLQIARRYLLRRQLEANGLTPGQAEVTDEALRTIIQSYTREAGVRGLEREIGRALRHAVVRVAEGSAQQVRIDAPDLAAILGPPRFENEVAMRTSVPGVATGLAWTPVGGDILFIEATRTPGGSGRLILTGQLGEVMRESAQAALSLVKSLDGKLGIDVSLFEKADIHIHVPAGAVPKDGPSAGVAMFTALLSLLTGRTVRADTAMTGEISLRGLVLPVGGIKEKATAAARAGLTRVLMPARNRKDWEEIPEETRRRLEFVWLERAEEVAALALEGGATAPAANEAA